MSLVLGRKQGENVVFSLGGKRVVVTVAAIAGHRVTLEIAADKEIKVLRGEIEHRDQNNKEQQPS